MLKDSYNYILENQWDLKTQTPHGGQEWKQLANFVEDFSVTTNFLGIPKKALHMCLHSAQLIEHYPASNQQPALNFLCCFLLGMINMDCEKEGECCSEESDFCCLCARNSCFNSEKKLKCAFYKTSYLDYIDTCSFFDNNAYENKAERALLHFTEEKKKEFLSLRNRILLGNGASELIDLVIRFSDYVLRTNASESKHAKDFARENQEDNKNEHSEQHFYRTGQYSVQYKEYERCAENQNRIKVHFSDKNGKLLCIVNPCNPTGEFMNVEEMKNFINENCSSNTYIIVDESMLPWFGVNWIAQSLLSQSVWIKELSERQSIQIYIINSWTKLWCCPGLRIGSLVAPTEDEANLLKKRQSPWSLNTLAVAFLSEVVLDTEYLKRTWKDTSVHRKNQIDKIKKIHSSWDFYGEAWLSYIWIDTKDENVAHFYVSKCKLNGVPIRWGALGYEKSTFIRIAVRDSKSFEVLYKALSIPYREHE